VIATETPKALPSKMTLVPFEEVITDATGGNAKVQVRDYLPSGKLPVIDQGQDHVGGFTDDETTACRASLPCILFGDHTKAWKWVDHPFALGADGVKVLQTGRQLFPKYAFHFLRTLRLPDNLGYSRHFKYVRRSTVPIPYFGDIERSLAEQKRIAAILDKADALRRKRREAYDIGDRLIAGAFVEMFGNPVSNSKAWPLEPLTSYGVVTTGNTPSREVPAYYGSDLEWIKSDNINTPSHILTRATEHLSAIGRTVARIVPSGSTLITCIAGSRDCVGNAAMTDREVAFNQQINAVTPHDGVDPHFLYALILLSKPLIQRASTDSMKGMVSKGKLEAVRVIAVPPERQPKFGKAMRQILHMLDKHTRAADEANNLFNSLVQRAFRGEL